jgi:hypothetical protein
MAGARLHCGLLLAEAILSSHTISAEVFQLFDAFVRGSFGRPRYIISLRWPLREFSASEVQPAARGTPAIGQYLPSSRRSILAIPLEAGSLLAFRSRQKIETAV